MTQKISFSPRNISLGRFVYTSAADTQAVAGRTELKNKARGGSRGANDTQLFRLLNQDEGCLVREATPLHSACQLFVRATCFRLTRLWKGLLHENQIAPGEPHSLWRTRRRRTSLRQADVDHASPHAFREDWADRLEGRRIPFQDRRRASHHFERQQHGGRVQRSLGRSRRQVSLHQRRDRLRWQSD